MTHSLTAEALALYARLSTQLEGATDDERWERLCRLSGRARARWLRRWNRSLEEQAREIAAIRAAALALRCSP